MSARRSSNSGGSAASVRPPRRVERNDTSTRGHAARGTGILRNELYIGRLIWNRMRFIKEPTTANASPA